MDDLRSQLAKALGREAPRPERTDASDTPAGPDLLAADAHQGDAWMGALRQALRTPGAPRLDAKPKLQAARQATDQLVKLLKKAGRKKEAAELKKLRDQFFAKRDKFAWTKVKEAFTQHGLSDKAYRSLKQDRQVDPVRVLERVQREGASLASLGAARLRDHLRGK